MKTHYDRQWLMQRHDAGETIKYLFFWGHAPFKDGVVTKSCLSQWFERPFTVQGITYPTAEHWMMAHKALLFKDEEAYQRVLQAGHPNDAKKIGREVRDFDPAVWNQHKFELVTQGNLHKFGQHPDLLEFLLQSRDRVIVEASPRDRIWGIGLGQDNPLASNPHTWRGENLLGFALMVARDELAR